MNMFKIWGKRIGLFLITNLAIMVVLTVIIWAFGIDGNYLKKTGLDLKSLAIISLLVGFIGALISLFMSKWMAKWSMKVKLVKNPQTDNEIFLVQTVQSLANRSGFNNPEIGIYDSPEINAFATGWSKNHSLVAVSSGLLQQMDRDEIEGVLAHEISHIRNGDMVTMTLIQGIMNTFVFFGAHVASYGVMATMRSDEDSPIGGIVFHVVAIAFQLILGMFANLIVMTFSRWREYRADFGSATLVGKQKMIKGLQFLQNSTAAIDNSHKEAMTMKIADKKTFFVLMSSHPPLSKRIEALQKANIS